MSNEFFNINIDGYSPLEVTLAKPDDFLKIRETLSRIGVASRKDKVLYQSCHILHKRNRYFVVHFKELFALDGKPVDLDSNDLQRRNTIAFLLQSWGLLSIIDEDKHQDQAPLSQIKIISYKEKAEWLLQTKYNIGKKSRQVNSE